MSGLCERCNPLGLRDSSASQVHGIAIGGVFLFVVVMAIVARLALAGIGPFEGAVAGVVPDGRRPGGHPDRSRTRGAAPARRPAG